MAEHDDDLDLDAWEHVGTVDDDHQQAADVYRALHRDHGVIVSRYDERTGTVHLYARRRAVRDGSPAG